METFLTFFTGFGIATGLWGIIHMVMRYKLEREKFVFEKLHRKRIDVIEETYKKIVDVQDKIASYMSPLQLTGEKSKEEKAREAAEAANSFMKYFFYHKIYFDKNLADKIDSLLNKYWNIWIKFQYRIEMRDLGKPDIEEWIKIFEELKTDIPVLKEDIEGEFRKIIGIKNET